MGVGRISLTSIKLLLKYFWKPLLYQVIHYVWSWLMSAAPFVILFHLLFLYLQYKHCHCFQFVNAINFSLSQCDHFKLFSLYQVIHMLRLCINRSVWYTIYYSVKIDNVIICLMLSVFLCPKVITLRGFFHSIKLSTCWG